MACCPFLSRRIDLCDTVSCVLFLSNSLGIHNEQGALSSYPSLQLAQFPLSAGRGNTEANFPRLRFYRQPLQCGQLDLLMELETAHKTAFLSPSTVPKACCKSKQTQWPRLRFLEILLIPSLRLKFLLLSACSKHHPFSYASCLRCLYPPPHRILSPGSLFQADATLPPLHLPPPSPLPYRFNN